MSQKLKPGQRRDSHSSEAFEQASWQSSSPPFVRRALSSLNSALHRSSRPVPIATVHLEDNRYGAMPSTGILYPQSHHNSSPHSHTHHQKSTRSGITPAARQALTYSTYSAHSNCTSDSFYSNSSTLTPMTTDDDASSTASHRPRTRLLSSPSSQPSPLSTYNYTSANHSTSTIPHHHHGHERSVSFTSSSAPPPSGHLSQARLGAIDINPKTTTIQLKVKHLSRSIVHSGYLSKYVPRTFFSRKQWKRRYFILDRRSLHCFKSSDPRHPLLESIELCAEANVYVTDAFPGKRYCIQISCPNERDWYVLADTAPEMSAWLRELKAIVTQFRNGYPVEGGGTSGSHFSEDSASISSASGQDHHFLRPGSSAASDYGRSTPRSGSPLLRPTDPFHTHGQMTSLSPPPRSLTPKPPTPIPSLPARSTTAEREATHPTRRRNNSNVSSGAHSVHDYISIQSVMAQAEALDLSDTHSISSHHSHGNRSTRSDHHFGELSLQQLKQQHHQRQQQQLELQQQLQLQQQKQQQQQQQQDEQQLEAEDDYTNGHRDFTQSAGGYPRPSSPKPATLPRSVRDSRISLISNHRVSVISDRSDSMNAILPRRSSQRMTAAAGPPRPKSPIGSLGRQGTFSGRNSPRNSLVVSPPPRSIHRPPSVAIRHSTQIILPPQIQTNFASHPVMSKPPTQSLPATPDSADSNSTFNGSLSRITSIRHQRELALSRQSSISSFIQTGGGGGRQQGVLHSRASMFSINSSLPSGVTSPALSGIASPPQAGSRPMSPIPSLAEAPTQPLPEPPKEQQQQQQQQPGTISRTPSLSTEPTPARRISVLPRHHQPDMILPPRSKVQSRSPSMERSESQDDVVQPVRRARSPPPRLSAVLMEGAPLLRPKDSTISTCSSHSTSSTSSGSSNSNGHSNAAGNGSSGSSDPTATMSPTSPTSPMSHKTRASRQLFSLPIRTLQNLPAPPQGQPPSPMGSNVSSNSSSTSSLPMATPTGSAPTANTTSVVFPIQLPSAHRRALSSSSTHSNHSSAGLSDGSGAVAVFGGAVARKSSSQHRRFLSGGSSSGSISSGGHSASASGSEPVVVSHRLSALISNGVHIPLPPTSTLPPVPTSASPPPQTPSPPPQANSPSPSSSPLSGQPRPMSPPPVATTACTSSEEQTETKAAQPKVDIAERVIKSLNLPPAPLGPPPAVTVAVAAAVGTSKVTTIAPIAEVDEEDEEGLVKAKETDKEAVQVGLVAGVESMSVKADTATIVSEVETTLIQKEEEALSAEVLADEEPQEQELEFIVVEEEEDDDDSEMDEVDVEDLKISVSKPLEAGSVLPAYYASKEEGVVDYIFPSEAKAVVTALPEPKVPVATKNEEEEDDDDD
ncbi:hypothetical protein BGZ73_005659 [Actinomortierella ambigua]|nr:hypothetical protein BGZ73_005659 [Actinomortierella ambigua]